MSTCPLQFTLFAVHENIIAGLFNWPFFSTQQFNKGKLWSFAKHQFVNKGFIRYFSEQGFVIPNHYNIIS